jgi:polyhydroxyalkanoate synthesis repressor PhaR
MAEEPDGRLPARGMNFWFAVAVSPKAGRHPDVMAARRRWRSIVFADVLRTPGRPPRSLGPFPMPSSPRPSPRHSESPGSDAETDTQTPKPSTAKPAGSAVRTLKKYPNRRLYDTLDSSYITLADVKQMVLRAEDFEVRDAKTGEDLTRSILLQIILEEESGGLPMFTSEALSHIIRFYGHAMQGLMGTMIEKNLLAFAEMQNQFISQSKGLYDPTRLSPELWTQMMGGQTPLLQNLMNAYLEQSRTMLEKMQQAGSLFPTIPGFAPPRK